jgi:hypothetical protein
MFLIGFDHQLMQNDDIRVRQMLNWLNAEAHYRLAIIDYLDKTASRARHTVDAASGTGAGHFKIAMPE